MVPVRRYRGRRNSHTGAWGDHIMAQLEQALADGTFGRPLPPGDTCPACGHRPHPDGCAETPDSTCPCDGTEVTR